MSSSATGAAVPASRKLYWAGWVLTILPSLLFLMTGAMSVTRQPQAIEGLETYGYPANVGVPIGITELACVALYLFPRTAVLGAILLTGYLGGATATHVRVGEPFFAAIIVGVLVWLGLLLRDARLRELVPLRK
ncbi:MAG TPA: DoxX family protein [Pirellulales bacterium]|jgi:hypothetical protein